MEQLDRISAGFALYIFESTIHDTFGNRLLAVQHQNVDKLAYHHVAEFGIGDDLAFFGSVASRHKLFLFLLGPFRAVFGAPLPAITDTLRIQRAADNVVANPGQILNPATADHDDRVVPSHSYKLAATLQAKNGGENPMLLRVNKKAGHGAGKPTKQIIHEIAEKWAFLMYEMGEVLN